MLKRLRTASPIALAGALALSLAAIPSAQARTFAEIYAECGLGAMLFNDSSSGSSDGRTLAIISNVTSDLGTTAISSNAFSEGQCAGGSVASAALMMQTYPALERDIARGGGEHLDALLAASGCEVETHVALKVGLRTDLAASPIEIGAERLEQVGYLHGRLMQRIEQDHAAFCAV